MDEVQKPESQLPKPGKSSTARFREIFVSWEKLRILYNLILAAIVVLFVLILDRAALTEIGFWMVVLQAAVIANVCFFAGPVVESYLGWLGLDSGVLGAFRPVAFVVGTGASIVVALLVLFSFGFSAMDMG